MSAREDFIGDVGHSYTIDAGLGGYRPGDEGVLMAVRDSHAGWTLYIQGGHIVYELYNGHTRYEVRSRSAVSPGTTSVGFHYDKTNTALALASGMLRSGSIDGDHSRLRVEDGKGEGGQRTSRPPSASSST